MTKSTRMTTSQLLALAGEMATAARSLVGGNNITIGRQAPANIIQISHLSERLRDALDAYDEAILQADREKK